MTTPVEVSWFSPLCDDDYELLGVPDERLLSSYEHCRTVTLMAEELGFDNMLLPSGYTIGVDNTAFAAGIAADTVRVWGFDGGSNTSRSSERSTARTGSAAERAGVTSIG